MVKIEMPKNKLLEILSKQLNNQTFSHAYLIYGYVDIKDVITILKINQADYYEIIESPIKIHQIRELIHWVNIKPHSSKMKLIYLKEVEKMTPDAANSLLKILEEPPQNNIFILESYKKEKLLPTIISRCQVIKENQHFSSKDEIDNYLTLNELSKMSFKNRFNYINELVDLENKEIIARIIDLWELDLRNDLLQGKDKRKILINIYKTRGLLLSNTSLKLLLENLVMEF